ncbi:FAD-dependent monooxygenase [Streptomyces violascens]|uniref:FAD-dependent monooxygenase n=1 Tax=Streptomyces violascens TaxID=67381 RepID=UPI0036B20CFD
MNRRARQPERADVLVIGGGPVRLASSLLFSRLGIAHVVVEQRHRMNPGTCWTTTPAEAREPG